MLANNFMTAGALDLLEEERRALIKVLGMLERDEIPHYEISDGGRVVIGRLDESPKGFNMIGFHSKTSCGTACCICGWAEVVGDLYFRQLQMKRMTNMALVELFEARALYDDRWSEQHYRFSLDAIVPAQAATALRSYLTTGSANWKEAVGGV